MGQDQSEIKKETDQTDPAINLEDPLGLIDIFPKEMPEELDVSIIAIDRVVYEDKIQAAILPTPKYPIAVLPGHTPLYTLLEKGKIIIHRKNGQQEFEINDGIAKVIQDKIIILIEFSPEEEK